MVQLANSILHVLITSGNLQATEDLSVYTLEKGSRLTTLTGSAVITVKSREQQYTYTYWHKFQQHLNVTWWMLTLMMVAHRESR